MERWLGWLLVALAALVWPAALLHEVTTVHVVCPEHGELLDVDAESGRLADSTPAHGEEAPEVRLSRAAEEDEHELCPFVTLGQPSPPAEDAPRCGGLVLEPVVAAPEASAIPLSSIPILLQAPKQSPPV